MNSAARPRLWSAWGISKNTVAILISALLLLVMLPSALAHAEQESTGKWVGIADQVAKQLDEAESAFEKGDKDRAKQIVKSARYDIFVGKGLEEQLASQISGKVANRAEMDFGLLTKAIDENDAAAVKKHAQALKKRLDNNAQELDGNVAQAEDLTISPGKWGQTASTMIELLDKAQVTYDSGDAEEAKKVVNEAYYGYYETTGFEKMTMARISGNRVATVELEFALIKKAMSEGKDDEVAKRISELKPYLIQDANTLDGFDGSGEGGEAGGASGLGIFIASFTVLLREGIEAMLVVAAVIAYLVKAGHKDKTKTVWIGVAAALGVSIVLAVLLTKLTGLAGKNQELIEGITALIAVAMLVYVSNWMLGKSDAAAWDKFIKDKTDTSLAKGSLFSLAFVAFLAVVREGAETILFYQPILAMAEGDNLMVWLGIVVAVVILVAIYAAIRLLSLRIPLRPFFLITSLLLAVMALTFTGSGIRELQEADVVSVTPISGLPTIDLLGIYPRVENLSAQAFVLVVMIGLFIYGYRKNKPAKN